MCYNNNGFYFLVSLEVMTMISETLQTAQFVVNQEGQRTAVFLPVEAWENLLDWIHQQEAQVAVPQAVQSLDDLWGDFWPEHESVDDFINTVRQWRQEDLALHRELP